MQWDMVESIFSGAARREGSERERYLKEVCPDPALQSEIRAFLEAEAAAGDFLGGVLPVDTEPVASRDSARPPRRIGKYRILSELGSGGSSVVYEAECEVEGLQRRVALKLLDTARVSPRRAARFRSESQILAALEHPNIARLYDVGQVEGGLPYLVMELVKGEPIHAFCRRHRLSVDQRLALFRKVALAVHYSNQNLVVHRDIKPANILVDQEGEPKLLDFGIAKLFSPDPATELPPTQPWARWLTPAYASPEQIHGRAVTTASDLYSLGAVLFELLAGGPPLPVRGLAWDQLVAVISSEVPPPPSQAATTRQGLEGASADAIDPDLDLIVLKALAKEPDERYGSVLELVADLDRFRTGHPVAARPPTATYRLKKLWRRHRIATASIAVVLLILLLSSGILALQARRLAAERDRVEAERDNARQIAHYLQGIFSAGDPEQYYGSVQDDLAGPTAREILDAGAARIDVDLAGRPVAQSLTLSALADSYRRLGELGRAEESGRRALELLQSLPEGSAFDLAGSEYTLGQVLTGAGQLEEAQRLLERSLERYLPGLPGTLEEVVGARLALGQLFARRGDFADSLNWLEGAWELASTEPERFGWEITKISVTQGNVLVQAGRPKEASAVLGEALAHRRRALPEGHPAIDLAMGYLADLAWSQGDAAHAQALYEEALPRLHQLYPRPHPRVASTLSNYALVLQELGRMDEAGSLHRRALEQSLAVWPEFHPEVVIRYNNIGSHALRTGDHLQARQSYQEALRRARESLPADHPGMAHIWSGLGFSQILLGESAEAEPALRTALEIRLAKLPPGHWLTAYTQVALGLSLLRQDRLPEAEGLVLEGHRILTESRPEESREVALARQAMTELEASRTRHTTPSASSAGHGETNAG